MNCNWKSRNAWLAGAGLAWVMTFPSAVPLIAAPAHPEAHRLLLVHNVNEPAGRDLVEHYRQRRGVPAPNVVEVRTRPTETITREEFRRELLEPLRAIVRERPEIQHVVNVYGVPLRIENDPNNAELLPPETVPAELHKDRAAVDSELAAQLRDELPLRGAVTNPFFGWRGGFGTTTLARRMVLVGRLDGPDPATVRRMMDDAVRTEQHGLAGRVCLDARGLQDGGYAQGDQWLRAAADALRAAGFEVEWDEHEPTLPADAPLTDVAVYAGWYAHHVSGPFRRADFRFIPGAVAYHIHSYSAASVRTRTAHWCGPLLAQGAAVTAGNVYEPYLVLTPHVSIMIRRLLDGGSWSESVWASVPALSWQTTVLGDPLYRPFAVPLEQQIALAEQGHHPQADWVFVRQVNTWLAQGKTEAARDRCRKLAEQRASAVLWEKLGDLEWSEQRAEAALAAYRRAWEIMPRGWAWLRVGRKLAQVHAARDETAEAEQCQRELTAWLEQQLPAEQRQ